MRTRANEIIEEFRDVGIELWMDGERLRYRAPQGAMTPERRQIVADWRTELVEQLSRDSGDLVIRPDEAARYEPFPLTDVQQAYLLGRDDPRGLGGVACHGYVELDRTGEDPAALEKAWNQLVARHDMLRATISRDGYQRVAPTVDHYRVAHHDLRGQSAEVVAAERGRIRDALAGRIHDTTRWPLFELRTSQSDDGTVLHLSMDSLIADWASAGVLLSELDRLLRGEELPELELRFRDYVVAERSLRDSARFHRDRTYWTERLDDLPPAPELPTAGLGAGGSPPSFERHSARFPAETLEALRDSARRHGITDTAAVLTAYGLVLSRWSLDPSFSLAVTLLDRRPWHSQVDAVVGDFTSVTILEVTDPATRSVAEHAVAVSRQLLADLDHRSFSGVEVLRELGRRQGGSAALVPVVFTSGMGSRQGGVGGRELYGISQTPQVILDCQVSEDEGGLRVDWDVRSGIFPPGVVEDLFATFTALVDTLATRPERWEEPAEVELPEWQLRERAEANGTDGEVPEGRLGEAFWERARHRPDAPAVRTGAGVTTYRELADQAAAVARRLTDGAVPRGERPRRVAVTAAKGPAQIAAVLGALRAGASYVPIDLTQPRHRRDRMLATAGVTTVLTTADLADSLEVPEGTETVEVDRLDPEPDWPAAQGGDPSGEAYVIFTSGSTGDPKGVVISHAAASNTVVAVNEQIGLGHEDRVLGLAMLGFDLSVWDVFATLGAGACLVLPDSGRPGDPSHWADVARQHRVTVWNSVPAQLEMLCEYLDTDPASRPEALRVVMVSGDWAAPTLPAAVRAHVPEVDVLVMGGATEAAIWSILHRPGDPLPDWPSIPYGRPLTNQRFRVLDRRLRDAPVWAAGELCIAGHGLAEGYLADPDLTERRFLTHPGDGERLYRTGDLGRYRPGGLIEFLGREDNQVKIRGQRIELGEIEAALRSDPSVALAAVAVAERPSGERVLVAAWTPAPQSREAEPDPARLRRRLSDRLPGHMVPAQLERVEHLPVTPQGKVDRAAIAALLAVPEGPDAQGTDRTEVAGNAAGNAAMNAAMNGVERRIAAVWAKALGLSDIGREDNFFDRGADSLIMARVAGRLREEVQEVSHLAYDVLLRTMLNQPTIVALSALLETPATGPDEADRVVPERAPEARTETDRASNALLVDFSTVTEGPTRVLFHAALGTMDFFRALAGELAAQRRGPVVGVAVADAERYCALDHTELVSRTADDYAERLVREHGPRFQLVGYCLGGVLAVEVARRLLERGMDVVDLTLVDSVPMLMDVADPLALECIFMPNLNLDPVATVFGPGVDTADVYRAVDLVAAENGNRIPVGALAEVGGDPGLDRVAAVARKRGALHQRERFAEYTRAASRRGDLAVEPEMIPALFRVCSHSLRGAYVDPDDYPGDLTFLKATEDQSFGVSGGVGDRTVPFWRERCLGEFTVLETPGNHFSIIQPPHVTTVARHLDAPWRGGRGDTGEAQ
ncbi:amino acid adenylation domain-containing protein [Streptomyces sp. NPDC005438]|uniref:non-ribosomal peptide synthetase n=1 Tax=Streptomyces sp. NPDC005438 TaxID=3156880 RepID=UPI0033B58EC6